MAARLTPSERAQKHADELAKIKQNLLISLGKAQAEVARRGEARDKAEIAFTKATANLDNVWADLAGFGITPENADEADTPAIATAVEEA